MSNIKAWLLGVACAALIGCGDVRQETPDAGDTTPDAAVVVDARPLPDASAPPPPNLAETVSAGGRVTGGAYSAQFQLGHPYGGSFQGGDYSGRGAAAINP